MTIDEAIEINNKHRRCDISVLATDLQEAQRLGIKALEHHQELRTRPYSGWVLPLPGETEE